MNQDELAKIELELAEALTSFNWRVAEEICRKLIDKIYAHSDVFPVTASKRLLSNLRRKSCFHLMSLLGEAIIRSGQNHPQIQRQYVQSLIDQGILTAAELVLQSIIQNSHSHENEVIEAYGLIGRIYKQLYLNAVGNNNLRKKIFLEQAINAYLYSYRRDRKNYWHAINMVALLKRGQKDGILLQGMPNAEALAEEVLTILKTEEENFGNVSPWVIATTLEALIALERYEEAEAKAFEYSLSLEADNFEINSTLRQLTEVWELKESGQNGIKILRILMNAFQLKEKGGVIKFTPQEAAQEIESINRIKSDFENKQGFEKNFGRDKTQTVDWYKTGLERSQAVARIETTNGRPIGTGWLVRSDFFSNSGDILLVTNAHVISTNPSDQAHLPQRVRANFQQLNEVYELDKLIWTSSKNKLDVTFLTIKGTLSTKPLPINSNPPIKMCEPPLRVYIIGHPGGRSLEISLHDSHLVGCNETFLHYRTPTEEGSSGSPVFDHEYWEVVALHHRGKRNMPRIDGVEGTYDANEGISVSAIKKAIQNGL